MPTTRWTDLVRSEDLSEEDQRARLEMFARRYRPAMVAFVSHRFRSHRGDAEDLVHDFIAERVVNGTFLERPDPERGRFRNLLRASLSNYCKTVLSRRARRPDTIEELGEFPGEPPDETTDAEALFSREWAKATLAAAITRMQRECGEMDRTDLWEVFNLRLVRPCFHGEEPIAYRALVERFALAGPSAAHNLLVTSKRVFQRVMMAVIRETTADDRLAQEEYEELRSIFPKIR